MFTSQEKIRRQITHLLAVFQDSQAAIRPHFWITGPSGSGKSFLTKSIAEEFEMPFLDVNAAQLTTEGVSGNSLSKALRPIRMYSDKPNVVFFDEFDKLFQSNGSETAGYKADVQNEILHCVEAKNMSVFGEYGKYDQVRIDNTLFIFAGSFNNTDVDSPKELEDFGVRREFVGRVPLVFSTNQVTIEELRQALPHVKLYKDYSALFPNYPKQKSLKGINELMTQQSKNTNIGVRLLTSCIHQFFMKDC